MQWQKHSVIWFLSSALLLSISACTGFKLRGSLTIPHYLKTVYITPVTPYEPFQRGLRERLRNAGVCIVNKPMPNVTTLELGIPEFKEQILAYSSSGQVQRSKVSYSVHYKLLTANHSEMDAANTVTRMREISKSNNQLLSNDIEEQIVRRELLNETVSELLRQITTRPRFKASIDDSSTIDDSPC
jgi:outer membrane lipopolysaccharide assembly protein LptE/RlpB